MRFDPAKLALAVLLNYFTGTAILTTLDQLIQIHCQAVELKAKFMGHRGLPCPHESYNDDLLSGHDLLRHYPSSVLIRLCPSLFHKPWLSR
jgi:hypothetical protein